MQYLCAIVGKKFRKKIAISLTCSQRPLYSYTHLYFVLLFTPIHSNAIERQSKIKTCGNALPSTHLVSYNALTHLENHDSPTTANDGVANAMYISPKFI